MDNLDYYHEVPLSPERAEARRIWREKIANMIAANSIKQTETTNGLPESA